jgi:hypothetical protein
MTDTALSVAGSNSGLRSLLTDDVKDTAVRDLIITRLWMH